MELENNQTETLKSFNTSGVSTMSKVSQFFLNFCHGRFGISNQLGQIIGIGVILLLMVSSTKATDLENLHPNEKIIFGDLVKEYLLENPEIMLEVFQKLEEQQNELTLELQKEFIDLNADYIFNNPDSWVGGNPEGDVNLVEFIDYRCGYCRRSYPVIQDLINLDPNIRLVIKEFPILGEQSVISSKLAIAVLQLAGPEKYEIVHSHLIGLQEPVSAGVISEMAELAELDVQTLNMKMDDPSVVNVLENNYQLAQALDINATPTFILGGRVYSGFLSLEEFRDEIDQIRTAQN